MLRSTLSRLCMSAVLAISSGAATAQVVISQVYGGGGNAGAVFTNDFIEVFNAGTSAQSVNGWSVQYASAAGTTWAVTPLGNITLQPGQYLLVQQAAGNGGTASLPTPDATGTTAMSGTSGKVALANSTTPLTGACPAAVDLVGFGSTTCFEGAGPTPAFGGNANSLSRPGNGCTDSNDNAADFSAGIANPRNTAATLNPCAGPSAPVVSFVDGTVSAPEGDTGDANNLNFQINLSPAPLAGSPVMFSVAVTGDAGRFTYAGSATLTIDNTTLLPVTISVQTVGNTAIQGDSDVTVALSGFTGTDVSQASSVQKSGTIIEDDIGVSEVFELQGSGVCSPLIVPCDITIESVGSTVRTASNVVTFVGGGGFFMQTPDARDDLNLLTSNGIFVFTFGATVTDGDEPLVPGDIVDVSGDIIERFGFTQIRVSSTRNGSNSILRTAADAALPTAVVLGSAASRGSAAEVPSRDPNALTCGASNFECFEAMRVRIDNGRVAASNQRFSTDLYGEVYASPFGERAMREKGVRFGNTLVPANTAAGVWDGNPEVIEMDADFLIPTNNGLELFGGTRFTGEGVIGFDFGDYEFWPATLTVDAATNVLPRPVPTSSPDELTIGSFNAFRFCDAVVNSPSNCAASAGAEIDTVRVAHQLGQVSAYIRQVLRSPDVVGMQEVENLDILTQLAAQIATDGGPTYSAHLFEGNDVGGIDVGYLINTARIANVTVSQLNKNEMWRDPNAGGDMALLHDRPPLLLTADFVGNGRPFRFNVINNHTRSRTAVDTGGTDGERTRAKRFTQALSIANLVQGLQTAPATADIPLFVVGDHNAYQFTDGYADVIGLIAGTYANDENTCSPANAVTDCKLPGGNNIVVPAMVNGVDVLELDERYSYNFTESFGAVQGSAGREVATNQVLDHAMFNSIASPFVTGIAFGRANVDSSRQRFRVCNYTLRDLALCPQGDGTWVPTGSSDHDGLVIFVAPPRMEDIFANGFEP